MHESALIFVPVATFGQLIPQLVYRRSSAEKARVPGNFIAEAYRWKRAIVMATHRLARKKYVWQQHGRSLCFRRHAASAANRSDDAFRYFGERMSAWVLISRLCFSTTRRSSRSMVLNASWITFLSGS
jgi:hypothetical protein